jgi:hypothetical protein
VAILLNSTLWILTGRENLRKFLNLLVQMLRVLCNDTCNSPKPDLQICHVDKMIGTDGRLSLSCGNLLLILKLAGEEGVYIGIFGDHLFQRCAKAMSLGVDAQQNRFPGGGCSL